MTRLPTSGQRSTQDSMHGTAFYEVIKWLIVLKLNSQLFLFFIFLHSMLTYTPVGMPGVPLSFVQIVSPLSGRFKASSLLFLSPSACLCLTLCCSIHLPYWFILLPFFKQFLLMFFRPLSCGSCIVLP